MALTILKAFKVLLQVRLCALTPGADRVGIVLEGGTRRGKLEKMRAGFLDLISTVPYWLYHPLPTHILTDDEEANTVWSLSVHLRVVLCSYSSVSRV